MHPLDMNEQYVEHGFFVARDLIDHRYIDAFVEDMGRVTESHLAHYGLPCVSTTSVETLGVNLATLHRFDQSLYLATLRVFGKVKSLYDLLFAPEIAATCTRFGIELPMLHTHPLFHIVSHELRLAQGYNGFAAHQDWSGLQTSLNTVVVWLPVHDVAPDRFPLEVLPGSHRYGLCRGVLIDNDYQIDRAYYAEKPFVALEAHKGDVVFMSPFTIHRTGIAEGGQLRIAASWRYEDALEPTFIARKYPFAQSRLVRHEMIVPGFPDAGQLMTALKRHSAD
jgi:hypothetical protein